MVFTSLAFFGFFAVVLTVYWSLPFRWQSPFLLVCSWIFYAAWDWRFLGLIILSTVVDYVAGGRIHAAKGIRSRRVWLGVSLAVNLGVLGYFKYAGFFVDNFQRLAGLLGVPVSQTTLEITLPVGISFYTFQTLSYTLDIYGGRLKPIRSLTNFATFVAFFPQLVAGPIVRAREFLYQLETPRHLTGSDIEAGAIRFLHGFVKKAFIANSLGIYLVDPVFASPGSYGAATLWLAMVGYAVQIYADFSGYSSMAIGSARMLGFHLPENFQFPYLATSISEFWRRWHMTMSRFFRDYVYIPLGGNRKGEPRTLWNLAATTLLSGLWHGAAWTFVAWGGLHGIYLAANQMLRKVHTGNRMLLGVAIHGVLGWVVTQLSVCFAWILFRSDTFGEAWTYLTGLAGRVGMSLPVHWTVIAAFAAFGIDHLYGWSTEHRAAMVRAVPVWAQAVSYAGIILFLFHAVPTTTSPFIYFQF